MNALLILATESGISYESPLAKLAVPIGILIFFGGPYLLLWANLGALRAYLVLFTSFFGFMLILSLFWAFGAPGTPANTGPTNLPGQVADEYLPVWVSFAEDSTLASTEPYASLIADESAFSEDIPADRAADVESGVSEAQTFFASEEGGAQITATWAVAEGPLYAVDDNGEPVIRVVFAETYQPNAEGELPEGVDESQAGEINPDGGTFTAYAFFDAGSPSFPSYVFIALSLIGFGIHAALLHWDERRERRERTEVTTEEREQVPAGV
jgi:hypothetical protein